MILWDNFQELNRLIPLVTFVVWANYNKLIAPACR